MNSSSSNTNETSSVREMLERLDERLVLMVQFGLKSVGLRLRGNMDSIHTEREEIRNILLEIDGLIQWISPTFPVDAKSNALLWIWSSAEAQVSNFYKNIYSECSWVIRSQLANMQAYDLDFPNKYNKQINYLDGIISWKLPTSKKEGNISFIHFLIHLYHDCIEEKNPSILLSLKECILILTLLPRFDINEKDSKWRTPLMRILSNIQELENLYPSKSGSNLIERKNLYKMKLQDMLYILENWRSEITWTPEQLWRARNEDFTNMETGEVWLGNVEEIRDNTQQFVLTLVSGRLIRQTL